MKWLLGLLCLVVLIIFHEIGHFIAAKIMGVKVESFSIGFGPVLLHKKIKDTDYRLSLIPLGGYCGMKGEKDFQNALDNNLTTIHADKDSLYGIAPLGRMFIAFNGPFFNFIFAIIAYSLVAGIGYTYYTYSNKIMITDEITCQVAREAGILSGDRIVKINNKEVEDFSEIGEHISLLGDEPTVILVERDGDYLSFEMTPELDKETGSGKIGVAADTNDILEKHTPHYSFFGAIGKGFYDTINSINVTFKSIKILFKGVNLSNAVSGPVRVTNILGSTVQEGFSIGFSEGLVSMFSLMAIISISLFIMNLLPIPVLDGGMILIAFIEIIIRRKIPPKVQYYIQFIGVAFIILIFIIGLNGDIKFFLSKGRN